MNKLSESDIDWLKFNCTPDLVDRILGFEKDAEKYKNLVFIFQQYDGGLHKYIDDLFCGRLPESKVYENLKKFFNGDNVLTKSEYKQKILGAELPLDKAGVDKRILRGEEK